MLRCTVLLLLAQNFSRCAAPTHLKTASYGYSNSSITRPTFLIIVCYSESIILKLLPSLTRSNLIIVPVLAFDQIIPQPSYYGPLPSKQKVVLSSLSKLALIPSACKGADFIGFCFALVATVLFDLSANAPKTSLSRTALVPVFP